MRRPRKLRLILVAVTTATLFATVPMAASAASTAAIDSAPSEAYELFRQSERDFMNRHR